MLFFINKVWLIQCHLILNMTAIPRKVCTFCHLWKTVSSFKSMIIYTMQIFNRQGKWLQELMTIFIALWSPYSIEIVGRLIAISFDLGWHWITYVWSAIHIFQIGRGNCWLVFMVGNFILSGLFQKGWAKEDWQTPVYDYELLNQYNPESVLQTELNQHQDCDMD